MHLKIIWECIEAIYSIVVLSWYILEHWSKFDLWPTRLVQNFIEIGAEKSCLCRTTLKWMPRKICLMKKVRFTKSPGRANRALEWVEGASYPKYYNFWPQIPRDTENSKFQLNSSCIQNFIKIDPVIAEKSRLYRTIFEKLNSIFILCFLSIYFVSH